MNDKDLLPCPFCGGEAIVVKLLGDKYTWWVLCEKCCAEIDVFLSESDAIEAWNTRVDLGVG